MSGPKRLAFERFALAARALGSGHRHELLDILVPSERPAERLDYRAAHIGRSVIGVAAMLATFAAVPAGAAQFTLAPHQSVLGRLQNYTTKASDTLITLQRPYDIGYAELAAANPRINPWLPDDGIHIVIPTEFILPDAPHVGVVINLGERRLYYFYPDGKTVETFPVGVGVEDKRTPAGTTTVVAKEKHPAWYPPPSIHAEDPSLPAVVPPGPDNPLGAYALRLGWTDYLIHGTNKPDGVGRNVSHGCIHLYPEDIQRLFSEIPIGTPVRVVDQPVLTAWIDGRLYVAVHPSPSQTDEIDDVEPITPKIPADLVARVIAAAGNRRGEIDWDAVERAGIERTGVPVPITPAEPTTVHNGLPGGPPVQTGVASRAAIDSAD